MFELLIGSVIIFVSLIMRFILLEELVEIEQNQRNDYFFNAD